MKAVRIHQVGGPEALQYEDMAVPMLKPGEVLVRNEFVGVNYIDTYHRSGLYKVALPAMLGREGAGVVEAVGEGAGAEGLRVGDRVAYLAPGAYAQRTAVPAARTVPLPPSVDARQGAALLLQGLTAHYLACSTYALKPGDTALVLAGAGGVGQLLIQIAKLRGARVIATVSSEEKAAIVRALGADEALLYGPGRPRMDEEARRLTGGRGVQVAFDSVGRDTWEQSMKALAPLGTLVLYGNASGPVPPIDPLLLSDNGALFLTRPTLAPYTATTAALRARAADVFGWVADGRLKVQVHAEYPLAQAAEAHRALEGRRTTGKLLLVPPA